MNCVKCGAKLPEGAKTCPACGTAIPKNVLTAEEPKTAVRPQTVPARPHAEYPARRTARREKTEEDERKKRRTGRMIRRAALIVLLIAAVGALIWFIPKIAAPILQNGRETPEVSPIGETAAAAEPEKSTVPEEEPDAAENSEPAEPPAPIYDVAGVWILDGDLPLLRETVWTFAEDGTLTIRYFGLDEPENPFGVWPERYSYNRSTGVLAFAGEETELTWKNEGSFRMTSRALGTCEAIRTDEEHIPTGAADIRDAAAGTTPAAPPEETAAEASVWLFEDSNRRYIKKSECEGMTAEELRLARNEIYARRGRLFDDPELQAYFDAQDWYEGKVSGSKFNYNALNAYERANVNLLKELEDAKR